MSHDKIKDTFDQWAQNGRDEGMERGHGDVVAQVLAKLDIAAGEKVLDLGCGNGWATRQLAQANAGVQAIGIDVSPQMIMRADELHSFTIRARYDLGTFEDLEFKDGEFTRIFSMEAIYYAPDLAKALSEAFRVLAPGGVADIVLDFYKESIATECWADKMDMNLNFLGEAEWKAAFEAAGFTGVTTQRVIDSRGPGDEASFEPDECVPDWDTQLSTHAAGSLWVHAEKPAG